MIFFYILMLVLSTPLYALNVFQEIQKAVHSVAQSLHAQKRNNQVRTQVYIIQQARKHTPPALASCKDLACVEGLLYNAESDALKEICAEYHVSEKKCDAIQIRIKKHIQLKKDKKPSADKDPAFHDEKRLGKTLVNKTQEVLLQNDMSPSQVTIIADPDFFLKKADVRAYSRSGAHPIIAYNVQDKDFKESIAHTIAHEVTHLAEYHNTKQKWLLWHLNNHIVENYKAPDSLPSSYIKTHEMQAELFPRTRLKDPHMHKQVYNDIIRSCLKDYGTKRFDTKGNRSSQNTTHPECSELLPYIVRIHDIKQRNGHKGPEKNS